MFVIMLVLPQVTPIVMRFMLVIIFTLTCLHGCRSRLRVLLGTDCRTRSPTYGGADNGTVAAANLSAYCCTRASSYRPAQHCTAIDS